MKPPRLAAYTAWGLITLGLSLRLRQYLFNRSLWLDEAWLALNIINRNVISLFGKLDDNQGAPLGFLLLEKLAATLLGSGELALRLLPLLAGCASLILFYFLARKIFSPAGTLAALALFAISPALIYYSSEVKQYSSDVLIAVLLLYLALEFIQSPTRISYYALLVTGSLALWFSHPALFVVAALGIILLFHNALKRDRAALLSTLVIGVGWLISLGLVYIVSLRQLSNNEFLIEYWREYFLVNPLNALAGLFYNPGSLEGNGIAFLIISVCGLIVLFARRWPVAGSLALVFILALIASWLQKYPFAGRMMLFAIPYLYLLLATAVDWLASLALRPRLLAPLLALALAGFILASPLSVSTERLFLPRTSEHIRPTMSVLQEAYKPGDKLYIFSYALAAWRYYAPRFGLGNVDYLAGRDYPDVLDKTLAEIDTLRGNPRVWIIFSHITTVEVAAEKDQILTHLNEIGEKKRQFIEPGTNVYLYLYDLK